MKLTEHLSIIEELVLNRASPAEIREHLLAMRPALESYDKTLEENAPFRTENTTLRTDNTQLQQERSAVETELAKFKSKPKPQPIITIKTAASGFKSIGPG